MNLRTNLLLVTILALSGSSGAVQALGQQQWMTPAPVTEVNTEYEEWAPFISFDGLSLYFSRVRTGSFYYGRIYQARRDELSGPFTSVIEISELNEPDTHILCPWVSPDNLRMYYHKEHGGRFSLAVSKRASVNDLWPKGTDIPELNVLSDRVVMPRLTADELTIFFGAYGVTAGQQEWDIWIATRADKNSPFDSGVTTSTAISSPFMDQAPSPSPDGLILYLASSRNDGNTSQLFRATRHSLIEPFVNVEHLSFFDTPGGHTYHPCISSDGTALYFMRQLGEYRSTRDIYVSYYIAAGRDYYVDAVKGRDNNDGLSLSAAFATIQKGIDSANDGDIIIVSPGRYISDGNRDIDFKGKAITVRSRDPQDPNTVASTVVDCQGSKEKPHRGFKFVSGEGPDSVVAGLTITNGYGPAEDVYIYEPLSAGGAIFCSSSNPTVIYCNMSANHAGFRGGGMCCKDSNPTVVSCIFSNNSAGHGGGMCNQDSNPTVVNCTFIENSVPEYGGGILNISNASPRIFNCTFNNNAARLGGGIYSISYSSARITNCIFQKNFASQNGGAMLNSDHSNPVITGCTFYQNSAGERGGGIFSSAIISITNCILWGNADDGGTQASSQIYSLSGSLEVNYCCIQSWKSGSGGIGNIDFDPLIEPETCHLRADSPCIDAGDPNGDYSGQTDIDRQTRVMGGYVDIGADEYGTELPSSVSMYSQETKFSAVAADPNQHSQTIFIYSTASDLINWMITEDCSWLSASEVSRSITKEIDAVTVYVDSRGLSPGRYHCDVAISDGDPTHSLLIVPVDLVAHARGLLRVPAEFGTIQAAIDGAQDGDTIIVADGIYTGDGNREIDFHGKPITVRSENGPANCIIDCEGVGRGFYFHSHEDVNTVLAGFTITNGYVSRSGGAVYCLNSSPALINCRFIENCAADYGGAIGNYYSNPIVTNCIFSRNNAVTYSGGAMENYSSNPILTNCTFNQNSAGQVGGAVDDYESDPTFSRCIFSNNSANISGGAVYEHASSPAVTNCIFAQNSAGEHGGALHAWYKSQPRLVNCTFSGNHAGGKGGAICSRRQSNPRLTNCIIWGNQASSGHAICLDLYIWVTTYTSEITVSYSDIEGGYAGLYIEDGCRAIWGPGNIDADPRFARLPEGLVSYWTFDEQQGDIAHDLVGDNHGTIYGAQWTAGKNNGGLDFDGDRDYVLIGDKDSLEPQQLTLLVWAKLDNPSGLFQGGIAKGYMFGAATDYSYQLKFHDGCAEARVTYAPDGACGVACPIGDSNWHLWTMTIGQGNLSIYKDGAYAGSSLFSGAIDYAKSNSNFVIGARDDGMHAFDGIMDDVMLFNRVLSAEEIRQLHSGQFNSYHLLPGSPCIDAGDPAYVPQPDEIDLYGNPRVMGEAIDMGAIEFQPLGLFELSVDKFEFEALVGFPNPADQILIVRNAGPGTLNWQISYDCDWLQVQPDSGRSKGEGNTAWLGVNTTGLSAGEYNCTLTISGSPASNSPQIVQVRLLIRKNCFPDTPQYAQQYADFLEYAAVGADPSCWCASPFDGSHYQCDGDASGRTQTFTNYRVFTDDLALIIKNWKKKIDTADPCADIDHKAQLFQRYRVFTNDLGMLITNWKKRNDQLANNCPRPDGQ